jgi:C4-dicarboxylate-binding protein DctP
MPKERFVPKEPFIGLFLFLFCLNPAFAEDTVAVRLSTQFPPESELFQSMLHFKERVEAESKGAIRIDIYDTGKPYDSDKIAYAVSEGRIEMGQVPVHRFSDLARISEAFTMPFVFTDMQVERASRAPNSEIRQLIEGAILEKANARVLWWIPEGGIVLLAKGASMADPVALAGKTVRAYGAITKTIKLCGGEPREVPAANQEKAYEAGQVDVGLSSIMGYAGRKLFRSMNTVTRTNQAILNDVVVINEKYWQSLPKRQRDVLETAAKIADKEAADWIVEFEDNAYRELAAQEHVKFVTLSDQELQLWRICSSDVLSDFMQDAGDNGQKLMTAYAKLLQDPCCNHPKGMAPTH